MHDPHIRQAHATDIPAMVTLYAELHAFHVRALPDRLRIPDQEPTLPGQGLPEHLRRIITREDAAIFVAEAHQQIAGLAEVYIRDDEPHPLRMPRRYAYLQSLLVTEAFRRQGLGEQLLVAAEQWAKQHSASEMQLDTWEFDAGPSAFYEAHGYRTLKRIYAREL